MAYEDDKKTTFPTRHGMPTGHSNERTMIDELGGVDGIRHRQRLGGDGVTTHVKTRGGHPHFWNDPVESKDNEVFSLYLDSGAVDVLTTNIYDARYGDSAPIYYSLYQQQYYISGKLLGKIKPPEIRTKVAPVSGTAGESFTPKEGADILSKKDCSAKCPPSMFTGKARLFAQSQLGAPLNLWKWTLDEQAYLPPQWVNDDGYVLDVHTGLYTDSKNAHWLLTISGSGVLVVKLIPSRAAKELVPLLSNPNYASDRLQIEAYILGNSRPDPASALFIEVTGLPPPYMLGYSWKFNWNGTKADIIAHSVGSPRHTSTHYRLTIARDASMNTISEASRWSFSVTIEEGPIQWHNSQYAQVIASPDWATSTLAIFGTLFGGADANNAPIYCFYNDDEELEVFRYSASGGVGETKYMVTSEPAQWMYPVDWTSENLGDFTHFGTSGLQGAEGERRVRSYTPVSAGFSCSGLSSIAQTQSYTFLRYTMSGKTIVSDGALWTTSNVGHNAYDWNCAALDNGWSPYYVTTDGVQRYTSGTTIINEAVSWIGYATGDSQFMCTTGYDRYTYNGSHVENYNTAIIIPFHDAEAVYMWGNLNTSENATVTGGYCEGLNQPGFFAWKYTDYFSDGSGGYIPVSHYKYAGGDGTYLGTNNGAQPDYSSASDEVTISKIVTRSGWYEFSPPNSMNPFFAGTPYVSQQYYTVSSVSGLLYGHGVQSLNGLNINLFSARPVFVGWA